MKTFGLCNESFTIVCAFRQCKCRFVHHWTRPFVHRPHSLPTIGRKLQPLPNLFGKYLLCSIILIICHHRHLAANSNSCVATPWPLSFQPRCSMSPQVMQNKGSVVAQLDCPASVRMTSDMTKCMTRCQANLQMLGTVCWSPLVNVIQLEHEQH